jgi:hypothetical protein
MNSVRWLCAVTSVMLAACSAGAGSGLGTNGDPSHGNGGGRNGNGGDPNIIGGGSGGLLGNGSTPGVGGDPSGGGSGGAPTGCGETSKAERTSGKADIVWIIDNSGSMATEAAGVQNNLNNFSSFITGTGIDVHVAVISSGPSPVLYPFGVSIDAPLGSGQPFPNDSNPPVFTHVTPTGFDAIGGVASHDLLFQLQDTYPTWQSMLRPDSTKTLVIVTDDENNPAPTGPDFKTFMDGKLGSGWRFSGVFCWYNGGVKPGNCSGDGQTYKALVDQTGGIWSDLGNPNPDWNGIFQQLADAVVKDAKPVPCSWNIPPTPAGMSFNPNMVNVKFTPSNGAPQDVYGVGDESKCSDKYLGWHFDDANNPRQIISCQQSCNTMQSDIGARVDVSFGCSTVPPPIM